MKVRSLSGARQRLVDFWDRRRATSSTFSIISNDCWGAEVYQALNLTYQTPFVGLMVHGPCFTALLADLRGQIERDLRFTDVTKYAEVEARRREINQPYPIGLLGDEIELHFLHERTRGEAEEKWNRRRERIAWDNLFFKLSGDKDYVTHDHLRAFDATPYENKVAFTRGAYPDVRCSVRIRRWVEDGALMYRRSQADFDAIAWLNGGSGRFGRPKRVARRLRGN